MKAGAGERRRWPSWPLPYLRGGEYDSGILGGGVAGLSAAHELAERGFEVTVYEKRGQPGGKARSMPVPGSGRDGRAELPAEHGFRFFPGFYRHLPDTMRRIPVAGRDGGAADNLVGTTRLLLAQAEGRNELVGPANAPRTLEDLTALHRFLVSWAHDVGIPADEQLGFFERLLVLMTSCEKRRFGQWEQQSWWEFSKAEQRSEKYGKFLADGLTRSLVAARAREMSARTGGYILLQLLFDLTRAQGDVDRVLNAPTSDAWIGPWVEHLRRLGVTLRLNAPVAGIDCVDGRIEGVTITLPDGSTETVRADHYIAALPVEQLRLLVSPAMRAAEPALEKLDRLVTRWMNGIMFYLREDVSLVHGHAIYIDSDWALTSISQAQFWDGVDFDGYADGRVKGVLSVDISEWQRPSRRTGKVAEHSTAEEIRAEVWSQLKEHLNEPGNEVLRDDKRLAGAALRRMEAQGARSLLAATDPGQPALVLLSSPAALAATGARRRQRRPDRPRGGAAREWAAARLERRAPPLLIAPKTPADCLQHCHRQVSVTSVTGSSRPL
ncbi:MAG: hypothetical protein QOI48_4281 [Solirubrobacteraceae bacterium]|nr:hypothetical protein [Solirubrobacteraceae bacterium]